MQCTFNICVDGVSTTVQFFGIAVDFLVQSPDPFRTVLHKHNIILCDSVFEETKQSGVGSPCRFGAKP